jgi:hypothetical protein
MSDDTITLLGQMVQELQAVRRELAAIREEVAPFAEERRSVARMRSPLLSRDLFHADGVAEQRS